MPLRFQANVTRENKSIMIRVPREIFDIAEIDGGGDIYAVHDADGDDICLMSRSKRAANIEAIEQNRTTESPPGEKENT